MLFLVQLNNTEDINNIHLMTAHQGNIEIRGKQIYVFPEGAVIKYFVIQHKQNKPQLLNFHALKRDARQQRSAVGEQFSRC